MTDGIIQKVIRKHAHMQDGNEDKCAVCSLLDNIEQELIEEIKKQSCHSCGEPIGNKEIYPKTGEHTIGIDILIGDNQE